MEQVKITSDYITLAQFLKFTNIASSGGIVRAILEEYKITVNGIQENRKGKKLYPGDKVVIKSIGEYRVVK